MMMSWDCAQAVTIQDNDNHDFAERGYAEHYTFRF